MLLCILKRFYVSEVNWIIKPVTKWILHRYEQNNSTSFMNKSRVFFLMKKNEKQQIKTSIWIQFKRFYTTVLIAFSTKLKQIIKIKINKYTNHKYENFNVSVSARFYILIDIWLHLISTMDTNFKQKLTLAEDPQHQNKILQLKNWKLSIKMSLRQSSLAKPFKKLRS